MATGKIFTIENAVAHHRQHHQPSQSISHPAGSPPPRRGDLVSWWKTFKKNGRKEDDKGKKPLFPKSRVLVSYLMHCWLSSFVCRGHLLVTPVSSSHGLCNGQVTFSCLLGRCQIAKFLFPKLCFKSHVLSLSALFLAGISFRYLVAWFIPFT